MLRRVVASDLPTLSKWDQDPAIIALMGKKFLDMTTEEWFAGLQGSSTYVAYAIETVDQTLIGELEFAHVNRRQGSAELRICIGEQSYWGQGFGTEALRLALREAYESLGLRTVYLRVYESNQRAVSLYRRLGFRPEAVLRPCARRGDPSAVILMNLPRERWQRMLLA